MLYLLSPRATGGCDRSRARKVIKKFLVSRRKQVGTSSLLRLVVQPSIRFVPLWAKLKRKPLHRLTLLLFCNSRCDHRLSIHEKISLFKGMALFAVYMCLVCKLVQTSLIFWFANVHTHNHLLPFAQSLFSLSLGPFVQRITFCVYMVWCGTNSVHSIFLFCFSLAWQKNRCEKLR